jgi:hypothetical protein
MKRLSFLFLTVLAALGAVAQTTRIVNNNPGATGGVNVYTGATALQTAINASVSGDIIYVVATTVSNGNVTINDKSLTILGVGLNPQKGVGTRSLVGDIAVNGAASSGTRISGIHFLRFLPVWSTTVVHTLSNTLIENCQFNCVQQPNNSNSLGNLIVRNCVINSHNGFSSAPAAFELYTTSGVVITNNVIRGQGTTAGTVQGNGLTVQNNLFWGNGTNFVFTGLANSIVQNNIFMRISGSLTTLPSCTGNTFKNNIAFGSADNTFTNGVNGNNSTGGFSADPKLTNVPSSTSDWVYTYDVTPLAASPVLSAGFDGTDIGPTGGAIPFDYEGTLLPLIESISMPAVVTKGTDLQVNVKARGN